MKKQKPKAIRIYHRLIFWLGVLVLGTIVGVSVQFGQAWVEPSGTAPEGNIAAPINTGASEQTKVGTAEKKADICVDAFGNGDIKCLSSQVSWPKCTLDGGVPTMVEGGGITLCKFPGKSCPSEYLPGGWKPYLFYSETTASFCTGGGECGTSVTTPFHAFSNVNPADETANYYDGNKTPHTSCSSSCCSQYGPCWDPNSGAYYDGNSCCHSGWYPCGCNTIYTCDSNVMKICSSIQTQIGCIAN